MLIPRAHINREAVAGIFVIPTLQREGGRWEVETEEILEAWCEWQKTRDPTPNKLEGKERVLGCPLNSSCVLGMCARTVNSLHTERGGVKKRVVVTAE